jgi:hypothetical protein
MRNTSWVVCGLGLVGVAMGAWAANPILGEVEIEAGSKIERKAGVWLDGQYVGFVKDLQRRGKLVLVPGEHQLLFKLIGYQDVATKIVVDPGERKEYRIAMLPKAGVTYPEKEGTARLRISVEPEKAAVFVNGAYVGHVDHFNGPRGMRLGPGTYRFTIALPGYQAFETELTLRAGQEYEISTDLPTGGFDDQAAALTAGLPSDDEAN